MICRDKLEERVPWASTCSCCVSRIKKIFPIKDISCGVNKVGKVACFVKTRQIDLNVRLLRPISGIIPSEI